MRNQPQVVLDQQRAGLFIPLLLHPAQQPALFFRRERLGEGTVRALHTQDKEKECAAEREQGGKQHGTCTSFRLEYRYPMRAAGCPMPEKIGLVFWQNIQYNINTNGKMHEEV